MKSLYLFAKRTVFALLVFTIVFGGVNTKSVKAESSAEAIVYYVSNGDLFMAKTDGSPSVKVRDNFDGVEIKPAGDYMYYMYDETATVLLRFSPSDPKAILGNFSGSMSIVHYETVGDMIYYMNDKGAIYSASANATSAKDGKLVVDMADKNYPFFSVEGGRVYYNALKDGRKTWVASKSADGSGQTQFIAAGAFEDNYYVRANDKSVSIMVNTKPEETDYSTDCMVLYTLPIQGGAAKAINAKTPLDVNAVYSGSWTNDYYLYNKGIRLGSDGEYDYTKGKGFLLQKDGKSIQLHKTTIYEIADFGTNKLAIVDGSGKAYVNTLANGKVTSTKPIALSNVGYVRNLMSNKKVKSTVLFGETGAYTLNTDLSIKKMVGVEWDLCGYQDDVAGIFYINAGDNGRLYRMNDDGKTSIKLADEEKVSRIVLITKL